MFYVGQKVECIDDKETDGFPKVLSVGSLYQIEAFEPFPLDNDVNCVKLISVCRRFRGLDWPFTVSRFRPIVERKTDISIFQRMLQSAGADA